VGAHAVARDAAGGVGGAPSRTGGNDALVISDLVDLGLAVVFAIVAITIYARLRKTATPATIEAASGMGKLEKAG
jgi:hypothetical protein